MTIHEFIQTRIRPHITTGMHKKLRHCVFGASFNKQHALNIMMLDLENKEREIEQLKIAIKNVERVK